MGDKKTEKLVARARREVIQEREEQRIQVARVLIRDKRRLESEIDDIDTRLELLDMEQEQDEKLLKAE